MVVRIAGSYFNKSNDAPSVSGRGLVGGFM